MATIKERDEKEFKKELHAAKYRRFNFSVKTSRETWNDENRIKVSVVNVEPMDIGNLRKHIQRLQDEIQSLQL